ncbi:MAG: glycine betaine/proline transport system ATP-binding protein [Candidatus Tokpelaia sp. JSC161]|jgi:glycine betaine/proline transport system ATP-binding protein|nr:MAG: glycine betaine/proline transport system ATP-binding protein [Candidatus Tokpelaia sp. JSC161]
MASITIENVSVLFGSQINIDAGLKIADRGLSSIEIKAGTAAVLGVHNCCLEVQGGETLVLMGLSGSGKSTLLRTVNGLVMPSRGDVKILHEGKIFCIKKLRMKELQYVRRNIVSMVFQQFGLFPWRTVAENVRLGLEIAGISKIRSQFIVMEQLELVGLASWADRQVCELSGGMQQRVGLARAFATGAPILLMDEPFSALDPLIRKHLQKELKLLQSHLKKTIIFVSHDLEEAIHMGDRIVIIKDGRIIQKGTPKDIIVSPVNSYVAEFVGHINPLRFLTAGDIMRPYDKEKAKNSFCAIAKSETLLADLVKAIRRMPGHIGVVDKGFLIGIISPEDILLNLKNKKNF